MTLWSFVIHHHRKASLVMVLDWRGVSANGQFTNKEASKDREEISNVQGHDCQHTVKGQFYDQSRRNWQTYSR
jgi:hypothetical protein